MKLPDKRLDRVLEKFSDRIRHRQTLSMRKLANSHKEEIQFGRFLSNPRVNVQSFELVLYNQCGSSATDSQHLLLLEDSTQMAFSLQRQIEGLGKIDKGIVQGYYLHPVLTLDADNGACHGVSALEFRVRSQQGDGLTYLQRKSVRSREFYEDKEAYRWQSSIEKALASLPPSSRKTVVADRESDIYAVLVGLRQDLGVDYVIRSRIDRALTEGDKLLNFMRQQPVRAEIEMEMPATEGHSAHLARLQLRYAQVELNRTESRTKAPLPAHWKTWVVSVCEVAQTVPKGEQPVSWTLLTSHPVDSAEEAWRIVGFYKQRWNIEQIFRLLKSRCLRFESSQLSAYEKMRKLMVVALMGAVKVLQLVRAREGHTNQSLSAVFDESEREFLGKLNVALEGSSDKQKNPYPATSLAYGAWVIARLAGWSGYQSQRPAGPTDFFTGLQRFYEKWKGYRLFSQSCVYT